MPQLLTAAITVCFAYGEAVWYYEKVEGDFTRNETTLTFDVDRTGTDTHLILRYFF